MSNAWAIAVAPLPHRIGRRDEYQRPDGFDLQAVFFEPRRQVRADVRLAAVRAPGLHHRGDELLELWQWRQHAPGRVIEVFVQHQPSAGTERRRDS